MTQLKNDELKVATCTCVIVFNKMSSLAFKCLHTTTPLPSGHQYNGSSIHTDSKRNDNALINIQNVKKNHNDYRSVQNTLNSTYSVAINFTLWFLAGFILLNLQFLYRVL